MNELDRLLRRNLLRDGHDGAVWTRHRLIAEIIRDELQRTGQISGLISGLAQIGATKVNTAMPRSARPWRILRSIINHDFLIRMVGVEYGRSLYGELEDFLNWDYHYWLQRGRLEVERGDLASAEHFLNQAKGLAPDDLYVDTERAYLWFVQAIENPKTETSRALAKDATDNLAFLIDKWGRSDPCPYHVLGSQGLAWARRGLASTTDKERFLSMLVRHVEDGCAKHQYAHDLKHLLNDLKKEYLEIAVPSQQPLRFQD